jgi:hypothetical protein
LCQSNYFGSCHQVYNDAVILKVPPDLKLRHHPAELQGYKRLKFSIERTAPKAVPPAPHLLEALFHNRRAPGDSFTSGILRVLFALSTFPLIKTVE